MMCLAVRSVLPHTTSVRGTKLEVAVLLRFLKAGAFDAQGTLFLTTVAPAIEK